MKTSTRTRARRLALQGLYEWQMSKNKPQDIAAQYLLEKETANIDVAYFREILTQLPLHLDELEEEIHPLLSRPMEEIDPVERAVLWLGTYELVHHPEIPYRVIINEAVELVKMFGAEQGHRFINGVMDKIAAKVRAVEVSARKKES